MQELGVRENYMVWECYEIPSVPFYCDVVISVYMALLQVVGLTLAFQTRKVKVTVLNDSKFVAAMVYTSSIALVILMFATFAVRGFINARAALFYGCVLVLATVFILLTFVPKARIINYCNFFKPLW